MTLVAVAHYPEGAGHATRTLAVARALEARGASVRMAGGGPGAAFSALNGYEEFEPTPVDYIGDVQGEGSLLQAAKNSVPNSVRRVREYVAWLRELAPAALVTDDMFAAVAGPIAGVPLYVLTHNAALLYDGAPERAFTRAWTAYQRRVAREFLYPAVWPPVPGDPRGVTRIPPVALDGEDPDQAVDGDPPGADGPTDGDRPGTDAGADAGTRGGGAGDPGGSRQVAEGDVLVVPSHYSPDSGGVADRVEAAGYPVARVGGPDWEPLPSLVPAIRRCRAVVCSGYSTVMEAAVAGTPCIVLPHTDEQRGVGRVLDRTATRGIAVVEDREGVVERVGDPPDSTPRENGAGPAAERVLSSL